MKPLLENLTSKRGQDAFMAITVNQPKFNFYWHYHPEYELTLIVNGKGRRLIGDSHENFENGDLVLIGPGLPHTWVSDSGIKGKSEAIVIQFSENFMERFAGLEELTAIHKLLLRAKQGILFKGKIPASSMEQIKLLPEKMGLEKITLLLHILHELSKVKSLSLASSFYQPLKGKENENRINKVCQYVQKFANESLTIHKAAALIHLSPSAFCKFFKRITGKTFSDYVNDIRIANVCSQLMATDKQVAEIAYGNGFESLTYFNRVFLKKKGVSPSQYRLNHTL
jgi:AraC-like DNA-binding protein/mannose-6-phosphate isomerase-like protein (cupin superfamily)